MAEARKTLTKKEIADAIRRATEIYRTSGVKGTIGTADVLRMMRIRGRTAEADELERLLGKLKQQRAAESGQEADATSAEELDENPHDESR